MATVAYHRPRCRPRRAAIFIRRDALCVLREREDKRSKRKEHVTQLRALIYVQCEDCGTMFDPLVANAAWPHIGDLVVRQQHDQDGFVITLVGASASQEMRCASREYAIRLARRAARPLRATVWETDDGLTFDVIATYAA